MKNKTKNKILFFNNLIKESQYEQNKKIIVENKKFLANYGLDINLDNIINPNLKKNIVRVINIIIDAKKKQQGKRQILYLIRQQKYKNKKAQRKFFFAMGVPQFLWRGQLFFKFFLSKEKNNLFLSKKNPFIEKFYSICQKIRKKKHEKKKSQNQPLEKLIHKQDFNFQNLSKLLNKIKLKRNKRYYFLKKMLIITKNCFNVY